MNPVGREGNPAISGWSRLSSAGYPGGAPGSSPARVWPSRRGSHSSYANKSGWLDAQRDRTRVSTRGCASRVAGCNSLVVVRNSPGRTRRCVLVRSSQRPTRSIRARPKTAGHANSACIQEHATRKKPAGQSATPACTRAFRRASDSVSESGHAASRVATPDWRPRCWRQVLRRSVARCPGGA